MRQTHGWTAKCERNGPIIQALKEKRLEPDRLHADSQTDAKDEFSAILHTFAAGFSVSLSFANLADARDEDPMRAWGDSCWSAIPGRAAVHAIQVPSADVPSI